jgi:hypothetical protein
MSFPTPTQDSNPAARISRLIANAMVVSPKKNPLDVWAEVLEVPPGPSLERNHEVVQLLSDCVEELRLVVLQLREQGVPDELFVPYVDRLKHVFAAQNLSGTWGTIVSNYLSSDVMLALAWCSQVLPEDSNAATDDDLAGLAALLAELKRALEAPGLPQTVRAAFTNIFPRCSER